MNGSTKQVEWAEKIKSEFLRKLANGQKVKGGFNSLYSEEEHNAIVAAANNRKVATWWIDRRLDGVDRMASNVLGRSPVSSSVF